MLLLIQYTLIFASVLILVALGGCYSEHSGVINLGLEGIMVIGALGGALTMRYLVAGMPAPLIVLLAILGAVLFGVVYSSLLAFACINLKADQTIVGTALNMLGTAAATVVVKAINTANNPDDVSSTITYVEQKKAFVVTLGEFRFNIVFVVLEIVLIVLLIVLLNKRFIPMLRADSSKKGRNILFIILGFAAASGLNVLLSSGCYQIAKVLGVEQKLLINTKGFEFNWFMPITIVILVIAYILLYKTKFGLRMMACGEHPQAANSVGVNVYKMRWAGVLISGALGGLGGICYILAGVSEWKFENGVAGFGFLALAVMIFGQWKPQRIALAALLFGFFRALSNVYFGFGFLQALHLPSPIYNMLPYIISLLVLAFTSKKSRAPKAEGIPYDKSMR